jgi:simple sugar transport system ATP-binding protein
MPSLVAMDRAGVTQAGPLVAFDGLVKRFGTFVANDHVSFGIGRGEIHALLGENGAGKSTLVKCLFGLLQPDAGRILWQGVPVVIDSPDAARMLGIAMVFQHFSLFENMTVLENIALGLPGRRADSALASEAMALATEYRLPLKLSAEVWSLSAGERQRIEIIRALLQKPRLLVLDEPTSVLTPQEAEGLFGTLDRLAASGTGIVFISHKLDEVRRLCSHATILRGGKVVASVDPRGETARSLAALMVGEEVPEARRVPGAPAGGAPLLEVSGLAVRPTDVHGVRLSGIDLTVRAGELVAIAGVAGSGQSELFAAISGEGGRPAAGTVRIGGRDVGALGIAARRDLGAAFVPEERLGQATLPRASLSENLVLALPRRETGGAAGLLDRRDLARRVREIVARFDVRSSVPDPQARRLSGGNLQKYVIGREILRRPRLLVVNQPTWGVDALATANIREALLALAAEGAAVLVISQDLDEVFALADRIAVLHHGRLSAPEAAATLTREAVGLLMTQGAERPADAA